MGAAQGPLRSGPNQVALVELFTSQGCSSCPPADRWLSSLKDHPGLWRDFVPLGFHVDYWDYIGWRDPFADERFSNRQREYDREGGVDVVYTPGVMLNGEEWRDWQRGVSPQSAAGTESDPGTSVLIFEDFGDEWHLRFEPAGQAPRKPEINVALLGFDAVTEVAAGENRGRDLHNDFIVLEWRTLRMTQTDEAWVAKLEALTTDSHTSRRAVAAWVSEGSRQKPLQAVGGWLPD
jgi:hypothetical protein